MPIHVRRFNANVGVGLGAVVGTVLRYAISSVSPGPTGIFVASLVIVALSCFVLGFLSTIQIRSDLRSLLVGVFGSAASLSVLAVFAITSSTVLCVWYAVSCPISAVVGLAGGVAGGLAIRRKEKPVVGNA